jgi:hypothetical protein
LVPYGDGRITEIFPALSYQTSSVPVVPAAPQGKVNSPFAFVCPVYVRFPGDTTSRYLASPTGSYAAASML